MGRIDNHIKIIETASRGEDVRDAIIDALRSLSEASGSGIDTRLDLHSTNPVQNKVLAQKFAILESKIVSGGSDITIEDLIEAYHFVGRFFDESTTAEIFNDYENNTARGDYAHAEGYKTVANAEAAHAEGYGTVAVKRAAHAENRNTVASGESSHAEGYYTNASGDNSHAEGARTAASYFNGHAEGESTTANGHSAHSEGRYTHATGQASHSEGENTIASGLDSHAQGTGTQATGASQHVAGKYNATNANFAEIIGNGTADNSRSNARTLDWNGNGWYAGKLTVGAPAVNDLDLPTLKQVKDLIAAIDFSSVTIEVDDELSSTSTNPVQNATIYSRLSQIETSISDLNDHFESEFTQEAMAKLATYYQGLRDGLSSDMNYYSQRAATMETRFNEIEQQFKALNIVNDTEY